MLAVVDTMTVAIDDFSAASVRRAHQIVESGQAIGKVVVHRPWGFCVTG